MAVPNLVDPLSVMLPTRIYLAIVEKLHPTLPLIREAAASMTAEEKQESLALASAMAAAADAVKKAVGAAH
jgi:hypothetical protein